LFDISDESICCSAGGRLLLAARVRHYRNRDHQISIVPFNDQVQGTILSTSYASNQRGCLNLAQGRYRFVSCSQEEAD